MARSRTSFGPGNLAALRHGGRSTAVLIETRVKLRTEAQAWLLALKPDLAEPELTIGVRNLADLEQVGGYIDRKGGPLDTRGHRRACVELYDRLLGRWDQWTKRNGIAPRATGGTEGVGLAALLAQPDV